jgi:hypothetical protein
MTDTWTDQALALAHPAVNQSVRIGHPMLAENHSLNPSTKEMPATTAIAFNLKHQCLAGALTLRMTVGVSARVSGTVRIVLVRDETLACRPDVIRRLLWRLIADGLLLLSL